MMVDVGQADCGNVDRVDKEKGVEVEIAKERERMRGCRVIDGITIRTSSNKPPHQGAMRSMATSRFIVQCREREEREERGRK
jgi:hypothetical protein